MSDTATNPQSNSPTQPGSIHVKDYGSMKATISQWMLDLGETGILPGVQKSILENPPDWFLGGSGFSDLKDRELNLWIDHLERIVAWFDAKTKILGDDWIKATPEAAFMNVIKLGVNLEREKSHLQSILDERKNAKKLRKPEIEETHSVNSDKTEAMMEKVAGIKKLLDAMSEDDRRENLFKIYDKFSNHEHSAFLKSLYRPKENITGLPLLGAQANGILKYLDELVGAVEKV